MMGQHHSHQQSALATPILELRDVSKSFGGVRVTRDLSFAVPRGGRVGLVGPNGAGKTTVFNLVSGVLPINGGSIIYDGAEISGLPLRRRISKGIARSFQNIRLIKHLSVMENMLLGQQWRCGLLDYLAPIRLRERSKWHDEVRSALAKAQLESHAQEKVGNLPYGIQKKLEIVRAMLASPKLLLLDEPAAGLNPSETAQLCEFLLGLSAGGVSMLIVEHDMPFIGDLCTHVVVLNFGEKIAEGGLSEVRANPLVQEAYLGKT